MRSPLVGPSTGVETTAGGLAVNTARMWAFDFTTLGSASWSAQANSEQT